MQTLKITIEDGFLQDFLSIVEHYQGKIKIEKDENLLIDPYFYDRQKELQQIRNDINSGNRQLISFEELESEINHFEKELELKYADWIWSKI